MITRVALIKLRKCLDITLVSGKQRTGTVFSFLHEREVAAHNAFTIKYHVMEGRNKPGMVALDLSWEFRTQPKTPNAPRNNDSKMLVHICQKCFQLAEIVLFASK